MGIGSDVTQNRSRPLDSPESFCKMIQCCKLGEQVWIRGVSYYAMSQAMIGQY